MMWCKIFQVDDVERLQNKVNAWLAQFEERARQIRQGTNEQMSIVSWTQSQDEEYGVTIVIWYKASKEFEM